MLPTNLKYQNKIEASQCKSYKTNIQPQNGTSTYYAGDTITINIPTRSNLVMAPTENYLKFTTTTTAHATVAGAIRLDSCGAHGYIQRVRVFHGSNLLSDIDQYGALAKLLFDIQVPTDSTYGKYNILAGTRSDLVVNATTLSAVQINSGALVTPSNTYLAAAATVDNTYCINLISLVGTLCNQKYMPLFAMTSAPLRIEIQLVASSAMAVCSDQVLPTFSLKNVEYVANFIELSDTAINTIQSSLNSEPLQFAISDFRNYGWTTFLANGVTTSISMPISAKYSSLKALFILARDSAKTGAPTYFPYSSCKFGLTDYSFRIGPAVVPSKAPNTVPEFFSEVVKAIGSMSDINHQPSVDLTSYSLNVPASNNDSTTQNGNINSGSFCIGLDLENYSSADKSSIFAGVNSNTDDIFWSANYIAPSAMNLRLDAFANFDGVIIFENGTAYVKT